MPEPINWEKFTQLTPEERTEMKTFVDTHGVELEAVLDITINEDYIQTQISQNLTRHRNGKQYVQATRHVREIEARFPRPKEASEPIFARGYPIYMTDNEEDNLAYQESLKTAEGRQAFVNRMVKDIMALDLTQTHLGDIDKEMEFAVANPALAELAFLTSNLSDTANNACKLDEPLLTAFNEKAKLIEFSCSSAHLCVYAASPLGLLLPKPDEVMAMKLLSAVQIMKVYSNEIVPCAGFFEGSKENEHFQEMAKAGMFDNHVRLKDAEGTYLNKGRAMRNNTPCTAEPMKPEDAKALDDQLRSMPTYLRESEKAAFQQELKAQGVEAEMEQVLAAVAGRGIQLAFKDDEAYPRRVEYDDKAKQFKLGEPITEEPKEPKKPGILKRLFHSLNPNWFKADFDRYHKDVRECLDIKSELNRLEPTIRERLTAWEQKKTAKNAEKETRETDLQARIKNEKIKNSEPELIEEEPLPEAITEMQAQYRNPNLPDGPYKQVLGMAVQARERIYEAYKSGKPYREMAQDIRTMIVERLLDEDRRSHGVNFIPGQISYDLSHSEEPNAVENFVKNVDLGRTMDNIMTTVTPYRKDGKMVFHRETADIMRTFALGNGADEAFNLCKKALAEEHKQLGQMQKPKELDRKQKDIENTETKVQDAPNILS